LVDPTELPLIKRMNHYFANIASTLDRSVIINRTILKDDNPQRFAKSIFLPARRRASFSLDAKIRSFRDAIATLAAAGKVVVTVHLRYARERSILPLRRCR